MHVVTAKPKSIPLPQIDLGDIRRFEPDGVLYEVIGEARDSRVRIRVLDTGEETLYPLAKALADPRRRCSPSLSISRSKIRNSITRKGHRRLIAKFPARH